MESIKHFKGAQAIKIWEPLAQNINVEIFTAARTLNANTADHYDKVW
jgi:hypothetical protein